MQAYANVVYNIYLLQCACSAVRNSQGIVEYAKIFCRPKSICWIVISTDKAFGDSCESERLGLAVCNRSLNQNLQVISCYPRPSYRFDLFPLKVAGAIRKLRLCTLFSNTRTYFSTLQRYSTVYLLILGYYDQTFNTIKVTKIWWK